MRDLNRRSSRMNVLYALSKSARSNLGISLSASKISSGGAGSLSSFFAAGRAILLQLPSTYQTEHMFVNTLSTMSSAFAIIHIGCYIHNSLIIVSTFKKCLTDNKKVKERHYMIPAHESSFFQLKQEMTSTDIYSCRAPVPPAHPLKLQTE